MKAVSSLSLLVPVATGLTGGSMMILGLYKESFWIALGFVLLATGIVTSVSAWGASTSAMKVEPSTD